MYGTVLKRKRRQIYSKCTSYRCICLMSVVGELYGSVLINRVRKGIEAVIGMDQCGFRKGRRYVDQIFVVKPLCEKFLARGKEVYFAFMNLEKAYDRVGRRALWQVVILYGVVGKLLRAMQSLYNDNRMCVKVGWEEGEGFESKVGLRQDLFDVSLVIQHVYGWCSQGGVC